MSKRKNQPEPRKGTTGTILQQATKPATNRQPLWWLAGAALLLFILTRIVYQSADNHEFVEWDDQLYVTENPIVLNHGQPGAPGIWSTPIALNYHPLTMQSLVMSAQSATIKPGQLSPEPFISMNINLHIINSISVLLLVWLLTGGNLFVSIFAAIIFAVHPMHVESVAWVSARKDVLYTCFFLLAAIAYLRYTDTQKGIWLLAAFLLFLLSCLSKAMAVSLVPVLLLLDWWRDRSLRSVRVWLEKIPFIAAAIFFGLVAVDIQGGGNFHGMLSGIEGTKTATTSSNLFSVYERAQFATYGMVQYIIKFFYPYDLSPYYAYPEESITHEALPWVFPASLLAFIGLAGLSIGSIRRTKILFGGFGFYFATVALVSQFMSVGLVIMADRYTYLPYVGLSVAFLLAIYYFIQNNKVLQYIAYSGLGLLSVFYISKSIQQVNVWSNSETLWTTAQGFYPEEGQILANLGNYYGKTGNLEKAASCFEQAIQKNVKNAGVFEGMGNVYGFKNNPQKAAEMFSEAIKIDPRKGNYYFNRGTAYSIFDPTKAVADFTTALGLMPPAKRLEIITRRGLCYVKINDYPHALEDYNTIIATGGKKETTLYDRGVIKLNMGDKTGAIQDFEEALRLNPGFEQAQKALEQVK
jgi:tetratricopeptide (TPR) repeat protein